MTSLRSKHKANLFCGIFFLILAAAVVLYSRTIPISALYFGGMNSRSFPLFISGIMAFLSLCLVWQSVRGLKRAPEPTEEELAAERAERKKVINTVYAVILIGLYFYLLKPVGYLISTPLFLFSLIMLVTPGEARKPARMAVICVLAGAVIYFVFRLGFKVQLPLGVLKYLG